MAVRWISSTAWIAVALGLASVGFAQDARTTWNAPQEPFRIYGNTHTSVLVG